MDLILDIVSIGFTVTLIVGLVLGAGYSTIGPALSGPKPQFFKSPLKNLQWRAHKTTNRIYSSFLVMSHAVLNGLFHLTSAVSAVSVILLVLAGSAFCLGRAWEIFFN